MCEPWANAHRSLLCYSSCLRGTEGRGIFYPAITFSEAVKQKELSRKDLDGESRVTLQMTSKCSCSEQCQFPILFVAGNILEGSFRQMHFPSQTSFLHSGWFLALAANAPNLWCQFYFRFHFCQQCYVLELDFASWAKQIHRLPFPSLCPPLGSEEQGTPEYCPAPFPVALST